MGVLLMATDDPGWDTDTDEDLTIEWYGANDAALAYQGNDLVHLAEIDPKTGTARVRVFASTIADAPVIFEGTVRIDGHQED